jgi:ABC-type glutathione transport system ATPase component
MSGGAAAVAQTARARFASLAPVLELEQVTKEYPGSPPVRALDQVSLAVTARELTGIVGPSGSGKSTLLHLMGTLDKPTSGTVRVTGIDVARMTDRELSALRASRIGFVFQQFFLNEYATVLDNVADGLLYAGVRRGDRRRRPGCRHPHRRPGRAAARHPHRTPVPDTGALEPVTTLWGASSLPIAGRAMTKEDTASDDVAEVYRPYIGIHRKNRFGRSPADSLH